MADQGLGRAGSRGKFYAGLISALVKFAQGRFYWGNSEADGASTERHVEIAKASSLASLVLTKDTFVEVPDQPDCPYELAHIWEWFHELDATRVSGMGFSPITHTEIGEWSRGMGLNILPLEREALRAIDKAYMLHCNKKQ